jgi:hypothetical protein
VSCFSPEGRKPLNEEAAISPVPRHVFFRDPDRANVQLSPDGLQLAWTQPVAGVQNVFIAPVDDLARARRITHETTRSIAAYHWAYTNRHLIVLRDPDGSENHQSHSVDIETGHEVTLVAQPGVRSFLWRASRDHPTEMLFGVNARDRRYFDVVRVDVTTGASRVVFENPGYSGLLIDETLTPRLAVKVRPDGSVEILKLAPDGGTKLFLDVPHEDVITTSVWRYSRDGQSLFMQSSRDRDTAALLEHNGRTGTSKILAEDPDADVIGAWWDPRTTRPLAALAVASRQRWHAIDPAVREDLEFLTAQIGDAEYWFVSQDLAMRRSVISVTRRNAAAEFLLYDRDPRTLNAVVQGTL